MEGHRFRRQGIKKKGSCKAMRRGGYERDARIVESMEVIGIGGKEKGR